MVALHTSGSRSPIRSVGFSSDGEYLAIGGEDHNVDIVSLYYLQQSRLQTQSSILTSFMFTANLGSRRDRQVTAYSPDPSTLQHVVVASCKALSCICVR